MVASAMVGPPWRELAWIDRRLDEAGSTEASEFRGKPPLSAAYGTYCSYALVLGGRRI
jgi:hypothetical protein